MKTWQQRIEEAEKRYKNKKPPFFTQDDIEKSQLWITLPVSEMPNHPNIKLRDDKLVKGPIDIYLVLDHIYLTKAVEDDDFPMAYHCFKSIQKQTQQLLNGSDRITKMNQSLGKWSKSISPHIINLQAR